jgi:high-affinity nickel permease
VFGLDELIAGLGRGADAWLLLALALLLGLRHASDPDHLVAVSTLVATDRKRGLRGAMALGAAWGAGHATTLIAAGLPLILFGAALPTALEHFAEGAIGVVIVLFGVRLLRRRRHGHLPLRSPLQSYAVGLLHGLGGTAAVTLLLLVAVSSRAVALVALGVFAGGTAISMVLLSPGIGWALARTVRTARAIPALGVLALAFGAFYAAAAVFAAV